MIEWERLEAYLERLIVIAGLVKTEAAISN